MARFSPVRRIAAVCVALLVFAGPGFAAQAEDLNAEKQRVDSAVVEAQSEVTASEAAVLAANAKVDDAKSSVAAAQKVLGDAQAALVAAQDDLAAAKALGEQRAAELAQANLDLTKAQAKEADGQAKIDAQKGAINSYARSIVQDNLPLVNVAALINTDSTATLANRIQWSDTVLATNQVDLDNLRKLQKQLEADRQASQLAQQKADEAKQAADAQVEATQQAEQAAQDATAAAQAAADQVQSALVVQQSAQSEAQQALANAQQHLDSMKAEQNDVNNRIAEEARRAEEERRRQEEAAAQAAAQANQNSGGGGGGGGGGGPAVSSSGLIWPVSGPITSSYGYRWHPVWGNYAFHDGTDIGVGCGTPIKAAAGGKVTDAYYHSGYGYRLFIDHGYVNGHHMVTSYNHMSGYAVSAGAWVGQGQTVGYVGTTGVSTGCHLHLMLWVDGSPTNAVNYLP